LALLSANHDKNAHLNLAATISCIQKKKARKSLFGVGLERWRAPGGGFVRALCGLLCFKDKVNLIPSAYGKKAAEGKGREKCGLMLQGFNTQDLWL